MNKNFYSLFLFTLICNNINSMHQDLLTDKCCNTIKNNLPKFEIKELLTFHPDLKEKIAQHIKPKILYPVTLNKNIKTFPTTHGDTYDICITKDGKIIAAPETDVPGQAGAPKIPIWNLQGQQIATLTGHGGAVMSLALKTEQEKEFLISASHDKTVKIWDLAINKCKWTSPLLDGQCNKIAISDNSIFVSLFGESVIYIFDFETGKDKGNFAVNTNYADQMFCHPNGHIMIGSSWGLFRYNLPARKESKDILPFYRICATSDPNIMLLADHTSLHLYDERMQKSFKDLKITEYNYVIHRLNILNNKIAVGIYPIWRGVKNACAHIKLIDQDLTQELMDIRITAPNNFVTSLGNYNNSHILAGLYGKQNTVVRICVDDTISAQDLLDVHHKIENKSLTKEDWWYAKQ